MKDTQLLNPQNQTTVVVALRLMQSLIQKQGGSENIVNHFSDFIEDGWKCPTAEQIESLVEDVNVEHHFNLMDLKPQLNGRERILNLLVLIEYDHEDVPNSVLEALWDGVNYLRNGEIIDQTYHKITGWQYMPEAPKRSLAISK
ncbi:hypothetical protein R7D97_16920 [Vibrio sp. Vb5031]|uniref:Uncharacterized protein n=1 Tax=Vibrio hepatarius TaxID=171383 RepID=A0A0M0HYC7_9VIBR|nr:MULTISPECIES: hypothetical protein [Vibrio]KOO06862.1 hypothetical protein AKJ31_14230 [Vibrio hepatarius]MCR9821683.1 hypothetical protein [Vibrio parahaemolyticus]MDW1505869.1 hypothetical protein [Vibrio sp. Vb5031]MDW1517114.1 hypothetical protein [Vibrio sp. Vb5035]MDW1547248.1 hypothetical protein [Vibrio sp. Vb5034]